MCCFVFVHSRKVSIIKTELMKAYRGGYKTVNLLLLCDLHEERKLNYYPKLKTNFICTAAPSNNNVICQKSVY